MGNYGTNDTGNVSRRERDAQLRWLGIGLFRLGECVRIKRFDDLFEEVKFGNCFYTKNKTRTKNK
jgi:hypothetical protein